MIIESNKRVNSLLLDSFKMLLKICNSCKVLLVRLKWSYDAFLKIIILCIWCNRIC